MMSNKNNLKGLFAEGGKQQSTAGRSLTYTAQLVATSEEVANDVLNKIATDVEKYQSKVEESKKSHDAMDELISQVTNLQEVDVEFLKQATDDEIDRMIKSQQSKRSRTKSKTMTIDNYKKLVTAAIAENLLRIAADKPKSKSGGPKRSTVEYTEDELQELANDQEKLRKAIRNIQSKKSIMKSKADFDPNSERYKKLLEVEEQLKTLRDSGNPKAAEALEKQKEIENMLTTINVEKLKASDSKEILSKIREMLVSK